MQQLVVFFFSNNIKIYINNKQPVNYNYITVCIPRMLISIYKTNETDETMHPLVSEVEAFKLNTPSKVTRYVLKVNTKLLR